MRHVIAFSETLGLSWVSPFARLVSGEDPRRQFRAILLEVGLPLAAIAVFLLFWSVAASSIRTSLGTLPGPAQTIEQAGAMWQEYRAEKANEKLFYQEQSQRNAARLERNPAARTTAWTYNGKPTYLDQIKTSLVTVFAGFLVATLIAVPVGLVCGLSSTVMGALNPLIQVFKPVSPLAWLPIVTMGVSAVYLGEASWMPKSFVISAFTVALCSLWPSLVNTALGVASIDKDFINVARVLRLPTYTRITRIYLPAALPLVFAGLRLSLGVGWMVLIAAEMLAQNPGLGKFVWDEFQNGSSVSLARIVVAVLTIGVIGFALDRVMVILQRLASFGRPVQA